MLKFGWAHSESCSFPWNNLYFEHQKLYCFHSHRRRFPFLSRVVQHSRNDNTLIRSILKLPDIISFYKNRKNLYKSPTLQIDWIWKSQLDQDKYVIVATLIGIFDDRSCNHYLIIVTCTRTAIFIKQRKKRF